MNRRWLPLLILPLLGLAAALAVVLLANGAPDEERGAAVASFPTPAPVTFIPPTPRPVTPGPALPPAAQEVTDQTLPDLTLTTLDGSPLPLSSLQGKIVFLNFWASWCVPCRTEMPALQALQDSEPEHVRVVAVTDPTEGQTEQAVRDFVDEFQLTLTVALSSDAGLYRRFGVNQIPLTYIADQSGVIRYRHLGELTLDDIGAYLAILDGPAS